MMWFIAGMMLGACMGFLVAALLHAGRGGGS